MRHAHEEGCVTFNRFRVKQRVEHVFTYLGNKPHPGSILWPTA